MLYYNESEKIFIYDDKYIIKCPNCNAIFFYINTKYVHKCPMNNQIFTIDENVIKTKQTNFFCDVNKIENKCAKHNDLLLFYNDSNYYCKKCLKEKKIKKYVKLNEIIISNKEKNNFDNLIKSFEQNLKKINALYFEFIEKLKESHEIFEKKHKLLIEYCKNLLKFNEKCELNYNLISTIRRISIDFNINDFKKKLNYKLIHFYNDKNIISFNNDLESYFSSEKILGKGKYYLNSINDDVFGSVHKGLSIKDKKLVSIKEINKYSDEDYFNNISLNLLKIHNNNEHCVKYLDLVEEKYKKFIVSESFDNNLKNKINNKPNGFNIQEIKKIFCQMNNSFKYKIQKVKCDHLNLTPDKILINKNEHYNEYKFCDYGKTINNKNKLIFQEIDELYIAPEVIENKEYTNKSDLFSIGILLYELYYGNEHGKLTKEMILENIKNGLKIKNNINEKEQKKELNNYINNEFNNLKSLIEGCIREEKIRIKWEEYFNNPFFNNEIEIELKIEDDDLNKDIKIIGDEFNYFNEINTVLYVDNNDFQSFKKQIKFDEIGKHIIKFIFENYNLTSLKQMFEECENIEKIKFIIFDSSDVVNMSQMFSTCINLNEIQFNSFTTSNVNEMEKMFYHCNIIKELNLTKFNTLNVTNMNEMFSNCYQLKKIFLLSFNTINVKNMNGMFKFCYDLKQIDLNSFKTDDVEDLSGMFSNCKKLKEIDLSSFNTSNVNDMSSLFEYCCNLYKIDLSSFNTKNVTNMEKMFYNCSILKEIDLTSFHTSNVVNMKQMFVHCNNLIKLDLSSFVTTKVEDISQMFYGCSNLREINYSKSSFNNVPKKDRMFEGCFNLKI